MSGLLEHSKRIRTQAACKILFGAEVRVSSDFLNYIKPSGLKTAYRRRALETHPDVCPSSGEDFKSVLDAYQLLLEIVGNPAERPPVFASKASSKTKTSGRAKQDRYHSGKIPANRLLFGQFLYYSGNISLNTLIQAITWQKSQRPPVGQIALDWGYFERETLQTILKQKHPGERFCDCALRLGIIDEFKRMALIGKQKILQSPFGEFFVENKILTPTDVKRRLYNQQRHNLYHPKPLKG